MSASTGLPSPPKLQLAVAMPDDLESLTRPPLPAVAATPGFFKALGIAMVRGRAFTDADALSAAPVVILSEMTARRCSARPTPSVNRSRCAAVMPSRWPKSSASPAIPTCASSMATGSR